MTTLILGLGNPILTDDGVGIYVVREAAAGLAKAAAAGQVQVAEASVGGLRLLDVLAGHDRLILVDAIQTPAGRPGEIHLLQPGDLRQSMHSGSTHDLALPGALSLGRDLGLHLPTDEAIVIVAIEVEDVLTFGEECTPAVAAAIPTAASRVLALVSSWL